MCVNEIVKNKTQSNYTPRHHVIASPTLSDSEGEWRGNLVDCEGIASSWREAPLLAMTGLNYFLDSEYPCRVRVCLM